MSRRRIVAWACLAVAVAAFLGGMVGALHAEPLSNGFLLYYLAELGGMFMLILSLHLVIDGGLP